MGQAKEMGPAQRYVLGAHPPVPLPIELSWATPNGIFGSVRPRVPACHCARQSRNIAGRVQLYPSN